MIAVAALATAVAACSKPEPAIEIRSGVEASCAAPANAIQAENCLPGTPQDVWDLPGGAIDTTIEGFATDISVNRNETVSFKVRTAAPAWRLEIYRLGWYQGNGARLVATVRIPHAQPQPACLSDSTTGLLDCGNWAVSASWAVPADAASGLHVGKLVREDTGGSSHVVFVVRDDASRSDVLFVSSDTTWQAYNDWGGKNLYGCGTFDLSCRAFKVSYNRPFRTRQSVGEPENWLFNAEYPLIRWLEKNGYDVSYSTATDSDRRGALIRNHKVFVSNGHDEYWSADERANVEAARDAGVNLAFFSSNTTFWKIRREPSIDGTGTSYRTLVCYKETHADAKIDPLPNVWTGTWRDPRFSPPADGGRPENALTGTIFRINAPVNEAIAVPWYAGRTRFWRGTDLATLQPGQVATLAPGTLGTEVDVDWDNGFRPPGLFGVSENPMTVSSQFLLDYGSTYGAGSATHQVTLYRHASGALVWAAGSYQWAWGLDANHDRAQLGATTDVRMQQATVNLLADMGAQPATLQADLVPASPSTDTFAPGSIVELPLPGAAIPPGVPTTIRGTASDAGGVVTAVEVSTDDGATWHPASGREAWTYEWVPPAGVTTIRVRAVDDSGNLEVAGPGVTVTAGGTTSCTECSLWAAGDAPGRADGGPDSAVEVGVRFRADVNGRVKGVRFFKSAANAGAHVGNLWSATGTLLATATFTSETASGWQQVSFPSPVPISAGAIYVASYHVPAGHYACDEGYFANRGVDSPPLHAPQDGVSGNLNGVFAYGASSAFPNLSWHSSNYWVDVVFTAAPLPELRSIAVTPANPTLAAGSTLKLVATGTYSDGTSRDIGAEASWTSSNDLVARVGAAGSVEARAAGTATVTATAGGVSGSTTVTVEPATLAGITLWDGSVQPSLVDSGPDGPVELGVRFSADVPGTVKGIRFYKAAANGGVHTGTLWSSTGAKLASATFAGESPSGWQEVLFPTPVAVVANTVYVASYFCPGGHYSADLDYFATAGVDRAPLHAPRDGVLGGNGIFAYASTSTFPGQTWRSSNYWVDVVFEAAAAAPLAVLTASLPDGTVGWPYSTTLAGTGGTPPYTWAVPAGLPSGLALDPATGVISGTPAASGAYGFTVALADAGGLTATKPLAITVAPTPVEVGIWPPAALPALADAGADSPVTLGFKFRSDVPGAIAGIRFYKSPANGGAHVGSLWTASGTLLASAAFSNESASGWQTARFVSPVPIAAQSVYVGSYHCPTGHYAADLGFFSRAGVDVPPLHALAAGVAGPNGVFRYGATPQFPDQGYQDTNYWVDVLFEPAGAPPALQTIAVAPASATLQVGATSQLVATASYSDGSTANVTASATWSSSTAGVASVAGGGLVTAFNPGRATISAALGAVSGSATVTVQPGTPPPSEGPGGPILVLSHAANPFSRYLAEILRAEGLAAFVATDVSLVTPATLAAHDVAILGEFPITAAQAAMFADWVSAGGNLVAMRPDGQLAPLLGLAVAGGTLADAYLKVDTAAPPGAGIVGEPIQFHGPADLYSLAGATAVATLYSTAVTPTSAPAVTMRPVGAGRAAAFAYDLARSIVYTRQGNPAWSGQERDGIPPIRPDDLFFGGAGASDWVDLGRAAIPQADEQQRLLANLLLEMSASRRPLPRFWYFPSGHKAVVVMTGDDHARGGTEGRFESYRASSAPGCSVPDWECIRSTSYVYPSPLLTAADAVRYRDLGFEIALHVDTGCADWTSREDLDGMYGLQLASFAATYPALGAPVTNRTHCVVWSDYDTQPQVESAHGLRLDTTYYYWPGFWIANRPGFMTGSGIPMRMSDRDGRRIEVYQAPTQMTDESDQTYPFTPDELLDGALGSRGFYGAFTANMHTDYVPHAGSDAILASALARGVPVISARQLLDWLEGRDSSSFGDIVWSGGVLSFTVAAASGARNLEVMVPAAVPGAALVSVARDGVPVPRRTETVKGVPYAFVRATSGVYEATYR